MKDFNSALMSLAIPWRAWISFMVFVNMVCPLFFIGHLEAKVVLAVQIMNAMIMMTLFAKLGFVRLLGLGHLLWVPMVLWLWSRLHEIELSSFFGWLLVVVIIDSISVVIDAVDVIRYIRGERAPY